MVDLEALYSKHAARFDAARSGTRMEEPYLERAAAVAEGHSTVLAEGHSTVPSKGHSTVLDVGCGSGEPIARYFIERGYRVTGIDFAEEMLAIARRRFPEMRWAREDMRRLDLDEQFDILVAWDSFFHLSPEDQRGMFPRFRDHLRTGGVLLFTSGTEEDASVGGNLFGDQLFHGSLSTAEYARQLAQHGFETVLHCVEDPRCGGHTIWIARKTA